MLGMPWRLTTVRAVRASEVWRLMASPTSARPEWEV